MEVLKLVGFIKNYSLQNIKNKLLILYILNVTDIIFTLFLLSTGLYMEANNLMSNAVQSPIISFILKIVLPGILFIFIYFRMKKATTNQLKQSNLFINGAIILYTFINISHLICFLILLIYTFHQEFIFSF